MWWKRIPIKKKKNKYIKINKTILCSLYSNTEKKFVTQGGEPELRTLSRKFPDFDKKYHINIY